MKARREARMVSACSPCTNIRSGLISLTFSDGASVLFRGLRSDQTERHVTCIPVRLQLLDAINTFYI